MAPPRRTPYFPGFQFDNHATSMQAPNWTHTFNRNQLKFSKAHPVAARFHLCASLSNAGHHQQALALAHEARELTQSELIKAAGLKLHVRSDAPGARGLLSMPASGDSSGGGVPLEGVAMLLVSYHNIGWELACMQQKNEAKQWYITALPIAEGYLGGSHPLTERLKALVEGESLEAMAIAGPEENNQQEGSMDPRGDGTAEEGMADLDSTAAAPEEDDSKTLHQLAPASTAAELRIAVPAAREESSQQLEVIPEEVGRKRPGKPQRTPMYNYDLWGCPTERSAVRQGRNRRLCKAAINGRQQLAHRIANASLQGKEPVPAGLDSSMSQEERNRLRHMVRQARADPLPVLPRRAHIPTVRSAAAVMANTIPTAPSDGEAALAETTSMESATPPARHCLNAVPGARRPRSVQGRPSGTASPPPDGPRCASSQGNRSISSLGGLSNTLRSRMMRSRFASANHVVHQPRSKSIAAITKEWGFSEPQRKFGPHQRFLPAEVAPGTQILTVSELNDKAKHEWVEERRYARKNPNFIEAKDGSGGFFKCMHSLSGTIISMPPPETEEKRYDIKDLSTFFKLSQQTGFSKKKCRELYKQWTTVTKDDMAKGPFCAWMAKIGFKDKLIVKRLFDVFDSDGGGSIDYEECAKGLSYIMQRDNHHIPLRRSDMKFYEICYKLLDSNDDEDLSVFEFFQVVQIAGHLGPQKALKITKCLFDILDPRDLGSVAYDTFVFKVQENEIIWEFFRAMLVLVSLDPETSEANKARYRFFELCVSIGALSPEEADLDQIKEQDVQLDAEAKPGDQISAIDAIVQHAVAAGMEGFENVSEL